MLTVQILILIAGLALVVFGADFLVDGASGIARKAGLSEFVIGLTIVGFGTSCPELVVSVTGALKGSSDIAIGNVIGSNIFNTLLILGLTATLMPMTVTSENRRMDIPLALAATCILCGMNLFGGIPRIAGVAFLLLFAGYLFLCFKQNKADVQQDEESSDRFYDRLKKTIGGSVALVGAGLCGLVFGGRLFVDSACEIARMAGISEKFIAITILAAGTSLPELATSIVAAIKGKGQLALGNILGSNVFNILLILGVSATITPMSLAGMNNVDMIALLSSALILLIASYTGSKNKIDRWEGILMLAMFAAYYIFLIINL